VALKAEDVGPAQYVSSVSSTLPVQRELDGSVIASASLVVIDTKDALCESGDLLAAAEAGLEEHSVILLSDYLSREPKPPTGRVVYKSIGSVEQDLALAGAVFKAAEQTGAGQHIDPVEAPRM
jgi:ornithine cyclodeaminase/alanine dehydrogenase-like protein (mu-crystallin family)